jgi:methyl-accepting chemotaxis protein
MKLPFHRKKAAVDGARSPGRLEQEVDACTAAMPILTNQLGGVRTQIEEAVLEVCASFQGIARRASASVEQARQALGDKGASGCGGFEQTLQATQATFDRLFASMSEACARSVRTAERIGRVTAAVEQIEGIIAQVEDVAHSTRLLTVNAKIQAVHAGEQGRGFVVIAEAISELSGKSDAVVSSVRSSLDHVAQEVSGVAYDLTTRAQLDEAAASSCNGEIQEAVALIRRMSAQTRQGLEQATQAGGELAQDIHRAVTAMQFQDRISQRLEHIVGSIEQMTRALGAVRAGRDLATPADTRRYVESLQRSYTMAEEHAGADSAGSSGSDNAGSVVLF